MKIAIFETKGFERKYFKKAFEGHDVFFTPLEADEYVLKEAKKQPYDAVSGFIYSNFTREVLNYFPKLKIIATRSTGTDHIDKKECRRRKIEVLNVPEYGTNTVAEHTWGLILSLTRKIYQSIDQIKEQTDFSRENLQGTDVFGKTLGIVGCGKIGKRVGEIARIFGCRVVAYDPYCSKSDMAQLGFLKADLKEVYKNSDIIAFHAPLTRDTRHIFSKADLGLIKKGVYIVNTARGGLVETKALLAGLQNGLIAGVALDVLENEEDIMEEAEAWHGKKLERASLEIALQNHMLINDKKVIITPHNAFNSREALERIMRTTADNILGS